MGKNLKRRGTRTFAEVAQNSKTTKREVTAPKKMKMTDEASKDTTPRSKTELSKLSLNFIFLGGKNWVIIISQVNYFFMYF